MPENFEVRQSPMVRIRHVTTRVLVCALAAWVTLLALPAHALQSADVARAPLRFGQGLLWKIERRGTAPSYLLGTIHIADPRVTALPPPVRQTFDDARSFTMEAAVFSSESILLAAQEMFFNDGRTLESVIGPELYARTRAAVADHLQDREDINHYKPWAVVMLLSMPPPTPGLPLDLSLQRRATLQRKPIHWLETTAEQLAVFNDLSLAEQTELLRETVRAYPKLRESFESMVQAYLARDVGAIMALDTAADSGDPTLEAKLTRRLLTDRNARMAERMRPQLREGGAFIAIGAAHLPGNDGVLHLLESAGYRVSRVY
jgi:uncharacterized protein YbaP (TraB family)